MYLKCIQVKVKDGRTDAEFRSLADDGLVGRFDTVEELYEKIQNYNPSMKPVVSFWEKGSLERMKEAVDRIR